MRTKLWKTNDKTDGRGRLIAVDNFDKLMLSCDEYHIAADKTESAAVFLSPEAEAKLLAVLQKRAGTCKWAHDGDVWTTACKQEWTFIDAGPDENHMYYCHGCGKRIEIKEGGA